MAAAARRASPAAPDRLTLRDTTKMSTSDGGWVLLGERPEEELVLGLVGKFWRPVIEYAEIERDGVQGLRRAGFRENGVRVGDARVG